MKKILYFFGFFIVHGIVDAESVSVVYNSPGQYTYGSGITAFPVDANDNLITIATSNITLDLGEQQFGQDLSNTASNFVGIIIQSGSSNVEIKNGTLQNFTGAAIIVQDGCSEIRFRNLSISDCYGSGIECLGDVYGLAEIGIYDCSFADVKGSSTQTTACISISKCAKVKIYDALIQGYEGDPSLNASGVYLNQVGAFEFLNCQVLLQKALNSASGIMLERCSGGSIRNCLAYNNISLAGDSNTIASGYHFNLSNRISIVGCQSALHNSNVGKSVGFYLLNCSNNIIEDSFAQFNNGQQEAIGFHLKNEIRSSLSRCISRSNQSVSSQAAGIRLDSATECYLQSNSIINNSGVTSYGLIDTTSPSTSLIFNNYAFNNGTNFSVTYTNGITLPVIEGSLSSSNPGLPNDPVGALVNISVSV